MTTHTQTEEKKFTLRLDFEEACLVRDAMQNLRHELKHSPSERGQRNADYAGAIAVELSQKIQLS